MAKHFEKWRNGLAAGRGEEEKIYENRKEGFMDVEVDNKCEKEGWQETCVQEGKERERGRKRIDKRMRKRKRRFRKRANVCDKGKKKERQWQKKMTDKCMRKKKNTFWIEIVGERQDCTSATITLLTSNTSVRLFLVS